MKVCCLSMGGESRNPSCDNTHPCQGRSQRRRKRPCCRCRERRQQFCRIRVRSLLSGCPFLPSSCRIHLRALTISRFHGGRALPLCGLSSGRLPAVPTSHYFRRTHVGGRPQRQCLPIAHRCPPLLGWEWISLQSWREGGEVGHSC